MDIKPLVWIGTSKRDLRELPGSVRDVFGYALYLAQTGKKHQSARPLKGFGGASVLEVVEDYRGDTYRAVYTVNFWTRFMSCMSFRRRPSTALRRTA